MHNFDSIQDICYILLFIKAWHLFSKSMELVCVAGKYFFPKLPLCQCIITVVESCSCLTDHPKSPTGIQLVAVKYESVIVVSNYTWY